MIDAPFVLLAAGRSTRMGQPKALLQYRTKFWLLAQVEAIRALTLGPIRVVLGPHSEPEAQLLLGREGVEAVFNPQPERGSFSSLQAGLEGLLGPVFVSPLDVPVAPVLAVLARALQPDAEAVVPTYQGRGGHPVLLGQTLVERLRTLDPGHPEARLDRQLERARVRRVNVEEPWIRLNLNTPEGWAGFVADSLALPPHQPGPQQG